MNRPPILFWTGLSRYQGVGLLLMRVGLGLAYMGHGIPKLRAGPELWEKIGGAMGLLGIHFYPTAWGLAAALTESLGGLALVLGFFFRPACAGLMFVMLIAINMHLHMGGEMAEFNMGWSHAFELLAALTGLLFIGPGPYSVDKN